MKEHVQKPGVRKWAGEDLLELQGETLTALQALVEPYAPCIIQGCGVGQTDGIYQVQPGIVALKGSNEDGSACTKIVRFAGYTGEVLPIYLTIKVTPYMRVYADEENKPIAYEYTAEAFTNEPADIPYLKIDASGGSRLVDTIGITQKLDREGGNASNVKVVSFKEDTAAGRINISAGMTMKELFGRIYRWLRDLQPIAFKEKVERTDFDTALGTAFDNKVDNTEDGLNGAINLLKESTVTPKDNDFYISQYVDGGTNNKTYWRRRMSALWAYIKGKLSSDTGVNISGNAATATKATQDSDGNVIKNTYAKKASIPMGVWRSNNGNRHSSYATTTLTAKQACTFTLKWLVSSEGNYDKLTITASGTTLVNAVSGENKGTLAETPLAAGAAIALTYSKDSSNNTGRDLAEISDFYITVNGVVIEITSFNINTYFTVTNGSYFFAPVLNVNAATTNLPGFMSAADKTKLDGIAAGANAYTHPTSAAGAKTSGLYKIATDANGHVTGAAAVAKSDITALGIPAQDTVYTHPITAGNKHIPNGGSSGQYLKYSDSGTAVWSKPTASEIGAATSGHTHTPSSIGAAAASHSHAAATKSSAGFMSAADKSDFDKMARCKIVGAYIIGTNAADPIIAQYGYKITMTKVTYSGEKSYRFTLSTANGFSSSKEYVYLCIAFGGYQHTADLFGAFVYGGDTNYLFHRNLNGVSEYSDFPVRMFIIECH